MAMTVEQRTDRALERGRSLAEQVVWVAPAVYSVPSQTGGEAHLVTDLTLLGIGEGLACDCLAFDHGRPCAHRGAVVARRQLEAAKRLAVRPTLRPMLTRQPRREVAL
jgi:hypothetical protein